MKEQAVVTVEPAVPFGRLRRDVPALADPRSRVAIVNLEEAGRPRRPIGTYVRDGLLWREGLLTLAVADGIVTARGTRSALDAIRAAVPDARVAMALPLHDGYVGYFGDDGSFGDPAGMTARVMDLGGIACIRRIDPHASYRSSAGFGNVAASMLRMTPDALSELAGRR